MLASYHCEPCSKDTVPLSQTESEGLLTQLPEWQLDEQASAIHCKKTFKNFLKALEWVNQVAAVAEVEGHHPDLCMGWGYAEVHLTTHAIGGLSRNDFIVAAKINQLK